MIVNNQQTAIGVNSTGGDGEETIEGIKFRTMPQKTFF